MSISGLQVYVGFWRGKIRFHIPALDAALLDMRPLRVLSMNGVSVMVGTPDIPTLAMLEIDRMIFLSGRIFGIHFSKGHIDLPTRLAVRTL